MSSSKPRKRKKARREERQAMIDEGLEFTKHSAVVAAVHQRYVKTGKPQTEHGNALNWLFELRGVADYGGTAHVTRDQAPAELSEPRKPRRGSIPRWQHIRI